MRLVKARPRYRCDYCSHTSTKDAMERHEQICWRNPNRHCESCNDTGIYVVTEGHTEPCYYCRRRDDLAWEVKAKLEMAE